MALFKLILCLLVYILCDLSQVRAVQKCFHCSTSVDDNCGDPFSSNLQQNCTTNTNQPFSCIKYTHIKASQTNTFRGCQLSSYTCQQLTDSLAEIGIVVQNCDLCTSDLCNKAYTNNVWFLSTILTTLLVIFLSN